MPNRCQFRKIEAGLIVAHVARVLSHPRPRSHPIPKVARGMALNSILTHRRLVSDEPAHQHFVGRHNAKKFGVLADLHVVIRCRRCRRRHAPAMPGERLDERPRRLAGEALEDASFVQRHRSELLRIYQVQAVVVADIDSRSSLRLFANHSRVISPPLALGFDLARYGQRRQNQRVAVRCRRGMLAPLQLARGLARRGG